MPAAVGAPPVPWLRSMSRRRSSSSRSGRRTRRRCSHDPLRRRRARRRRATWCAYVKALCVGGDRRWMVGTPTVGPPRQPFRARKSASGVQRSSGPFQQGHHIKRRLKKRQISPQADPLPVWRSSGQRRAPRRAERRLDRRRASAWRAPLGARHTSVRRSEQVVCETLLSAAR